MRILDDLREIPEFRKMCTIYLIAALIWCCAIFVIMELASLSDRTIRDIDAGDQLIDLAIQFKGSAPSQGGGGERTLVGEPLTVISEIIDALELRERMVQLQSNVSGLTIQLERIYGNELGEFLTTIDSRGLVVKTCEIRALPSGEDRLLSVSMMLGQ